MDSLIFIFFAASLQQRSKQAESPKSGEPTDRPDLSGRGQGHASGRACHHPDFWTPPAILDIGSFISFIAR